MTRPLAPPLFTPTPRKGRKERVRKSTTPSALVMRITTSLLFASNVSLTISALFLVDMLLSDRWIDPRIAATFSILGLAISFYLVFTREPWQGMRSHLVLGGRRLILFAFATVTNVMLINLIELQASIPETPTTGGTCFAPECSA